MAAYLKLVDGSIFNGNPITFAVTPLKIEGTPAFHRMVFEVKCGISGGSYETIRLTESVLTEDGKVVTVDISSALRSFRDSYEYSPEPGIMPVVKFNVSAYDNDSLSTTTLINGKVELSNGSQHLTLSPGQAATLNRTTSKLSLSKANTQADAWRTGKLMYSDISMKEFAQILERQYDVNVNIASPQCADMRISVMLQNNETIDEVLQAIEQITSHKASRNDRNITIR